MPNSVFTFFFFFFLLLVKFQETNNNILKLGRNGSTLVGDVQPKAPLAAYAGGMRIGLNGGCVRHI